MRYSLPLRLDRRRWLQGCAALTVGSGAGLLGCTGFTKPPSALPARNALVFDQLVVYSNFPLPRQHRLMEELRQLRGDLLAKLALPASDEPINVYLFETVDQFRDFLHDHHPDFPSRRAFFVESDTRLAVYAQWGDRVAEDLRHEVAHGYLHSVVRNVPLWLDEGIAEYFEVPRHAVGLNTAHIRLLTTRFVSDEWQPNLKRLEQLSSAGSMTQEDYAEAWLWTHWLLETDPARTNLFHGYLQALRKNETVEPLSAAIPRLAPEADKALVHHLFALAPRAAG